jgi:hypothetical protein
MQEWRAANPQLAEQYDQSWTKTLPSGFEMKVVEAVKTDKPAATRDLSNAAIQAIGPMAPFLVGGAADLSGSTKTVFKDGGNISLQIFWQEETGFWGSGNYNINSPLLAEKKSIEYKVSTESPVTRHRSIDIHLATTGGEVEDDIMVSIGEKDASEWQPFNSVINYSLSAGDGQKTVIVKFRDRAENIKEDSVKIELDTQPPIITLLEKSSIDPQTVQLKWTANEVVNSKLRLFTKQGNWLEVPVLADINGIYSTDVSLDSVVFCQIAAQDNAGNLKLIVDESLNTQLREVTSIAFEINDGAQQTTSRWITIKATADNIKWAVSNDLVSWSNWKDGNARLTWRINPGEGEHLIFIKYKTETAGLIHYNVVNVSVNSGGN